MNPILIGVVPVFALLALGWTLKVRNFLPEDGWGPVERLTYFVFCRAAVKPRSRSSC